MLQVNLCNAIEKAYQSSSVCPIPKEILTLSPPKRHAYNSYSPERALMDVVLLIRMSNEVPG